MSWGELSCKFYFEGCPNLNRGPSTCMCACRGYKHDGVTEPDYPKPWVEPTGIMNHHQIVEEGQIGPRMVIKYTPNPDVPYCPKSDTASSRMCGERRWPRNKNPKKKVKANIAKKSRKLNKRKK